MKFTLVVRQSAVLEAGLLGKVGLHDLCLLDYLRGWFFCDGAKIKVVDGRKFIWLRYETAIEELPLIFNPQSQIASRKNKLSAMIEKLRDTGLVETIQMRRLYFRLTDIAIRVTQGYNHSTQKAKGLAPIVPPPRDESVTIERDRTITSLRDEYLPTNIDETGTMESENREAPPLSPSEGEAESTLAFWNSFSQLLPALAITPNRARKIRKRLADPWWREHWQAGIERVAISDFAKGGGPHGWRATFDWFLGGDSLAKILEGSYDNRPQPDRKLLPCDMKAQIKAVDEIMASHPANDDCACYDEDATEEQRQDLEDFDAAAKSLYGSSQASPSDRVTNAACVARCATRRRFARVRDEVAECGSIVLQLNCDASSGTSAPSCTETKLVFGFG